MKPRLVVVYVLLIVLPLALLAALGVRLVHFERRETQQRFRELLLGRLKEIGRGIDDLVERRKREVLRLTETESFDPETLRTIARRNPIVSQVFLLDSEGNLLHPKPSSDLNAGERAFLERTHEIWERRVLAAPDNRQTQQGAVSTQQSAEAMQRIAPSRTFLPQTARGIPAAESNVQTDETFYLQTTAGPEDGESASAPSVGLSVWYWGRDIDLLVWRRLPNGHVIGAELDHSRFLADAISVLPDTDPRTDALGEGRIALVDSIGSPIYEWGVYDPPKGDEPLVERALEPPLAAWALQWHLPAESLAGPGEKGLWFSLVAGLLAVGVAIAGLAVYFYRENSREMREAAQRVSFVNQVSHELKTPLTNIRMYAELLHENADDEDETARQRLGVIVSESQRLSRLIGNILSFGRRQRNHLTLHLTEGTIDDTVRAVLDGFRPSFETRGIEPSFHGGAPGRVRFDRDVLEQILGNLFSNVEKYAAEGKSVRVETRQRDAETTITVADSGPGIPPRERERVFRPFHRISNKITDGVSGTGIGLTISRDLARLHGGDLTLAPSDRGAAFELRLATPPYADGGTS
ncbi:HAMP domain-containing histidine kinase [Candidatus Sumerlaeota bacterium]|nr:HAMP domain-containing histidine kinase [Candidatus Sumerlaeota bacterium]